MKHIKTFESFEVNEEFLPVAGGALGLIVLYGILWGYKKIDNLVDFVKFKNAKNKLEPIFDKIKDDPKIKELLDELYEYKDGLYYGEEEGENPRRTKANKIKNKIYNRASQLLTTKECEKFIYYLETFEQGVEKPGGYFIDKEDKFKGFKYGV